MVPMQVRVLGPVHRRGSLKDYPIIQAQQALMSRQSMVLELCYRKAGRKREGRKREISHSHVERRGKDGEKEG